MRKKTATRSRRSESHRKRPDYVPGYTFEQAKADRVKQFLETCVTMTEGGKWAGKPMQLMPWQNDILDSVYGWVDSDGRRRIRRAAVFVPKKNGKDLAVDTPVMTTKGWSTMGELRVGDFVFHPSGKPVMVVAKSEVFTKNRCYRLSFSQTGETIVAGEGHLWRTFDQNKTNSKDHEGVRTTGEIAKTLRWKYGNRHSIEMQRPLRFRKATLPLPPYVLGAWLGDGTSKNASLTCGKKDSGEMAGNLSACCVPVKVFRCKGKTALTISLSDGKKDRTKDCPKKALREIGVLGNKHIPDDYATASVSQRLDLLRGLMDTDGTVNKKGICEFCVCSERLASDVFDLLASLGIKSSVKASNAVLCGNAVGTRYRLIFKPPVGMQVFALKRKAERLACAARTSRQPRSRYRHITSCEPVDSVSTQCIQVDSPDGMFLAGRSLIPTHNSGMMAGLALYHLLADNEPGAFVAIAACDRHQAGIIFRAIAASIRANPHLERVLDIVDSRSTIIHKASNSRIVAMSADSWRAEGINASAIIVDELHAHRKPDLVRALLYAGASRAQPLCIAISTAGDDRNGIGYEWWKDCELVQKDPRAIPTFYGRIWRAEDDEDHSDPKVWKKANPSLGVTIDPKAFKAEYEDASTSPSKLAVFLRYRLNVWSDMDTRFLDAARWDACNGEPVPMDGRPVWVGVDLASNIDMSAASFVYKDDDGGWNVQMKYWVPADSIHARERETGMPYQQWVRDGYMEATDGGRLDHERVARDIIEISRTSHIVGIGVDPWQVGPLATFLQREGLEVTAVRQNTSSMNAPCRLLEGVVAENQLRHGGHPILNMNAYNCVTYADTTGMIKPDKNKNRMIDGIVATINAFALASKAEEASWEMSLL